MIRCSSCNAPNPDTSTNCYSCKAPLQQSVPPVTQQMAAVQQAPPPPPQAVPQTDPQDIIALKKYPALRIIANICEILAYVFPAMVIMAGLFAASMGGFRSICSEAFGVFAVLFLSLIAALILWLIFKFASESIHVLIDLEENTRIIAHRQ